MSFNDDLLELIEALQRQPQNEQAVRMAARLKKAQQAYYRAYDKAGRLARDAEELLCILEGGEEDADGEEEALEAMERGICRAEDDAEREGC